MDATGMDRNAIGVTMPLTETTARLADILRRDLKLGPHTVLDPDTVLFGGDLDLDSLDALLLLQSVEREFGFKTPSEAIGPHVFRTLSSLAGFVEERVRLATS